MASEITARKLSSGWWHIKGPEVGGIMLTAEDANAYHSLQERYEAAERERDVLLGQLSQKAYSVLAENTRLRKALVDIAKEGGDLKEHWVRLAQRALAESPEVPND